MGRTVVRTQMRTGNIRKIIAFIDMKLCEEKFEEKLVDGEDVWMKGDGVFSAMSCITVTFRENTAIIQGWLKSSRLGELSLDRSGCGKMRDLIDEIRYAIEQTDF